MHWVAASEKDIATDTLEKRLWAAADQFRANSGLNAAQYSQPVLGLIFLRFEILCPPQPLVASAEEHSVPIHNEIGTLNHQIQNLLLPHLLSGHVNVQI